MTAGHRSREAYSNWKTVFGYAPNKMIYISNW